MAGPRAVAVAAGARVGGTAVAAAARVGSGALVGRAGGTAGAWVAAGATCCWIAAGAAVGALAGTGVAAGAQAASASARMDAQASKTFTISRVFIFLLSFWWAGSAWPALLNRSAHYMRAERVLFTLCVVRGRKGSPLKPVNRRWASIGSLCRNHVTSQSSTVGIEAAWRVPLAPAGRRGDPACLLNSCSRRDPSACRDRCSSCRPGRRSRRQTCRR